MSVKSSVQSLDHSPGLIRTLYSPCDTVVKSMEKTLMMIHACALVPRKIIM